MKSKLLHTWITHAISATHSRNLIEKMMSSSNESYQIQEIDFARSSILELDDGGNIKT